MRRHGPVIAHCTDSEDFATLELECVTGTKSEGRLNLFAVLQIVQISAVAIWCIVECE